MMGAEAPETCWATHKRQVINLSNCCIWLVVWFIWLVWWRTDLPMSNTQGYLIGYGLKEYSSVCHRPCPQPSQYYLFTSDHPTCLISILIFLSVLYITIYLHEVEYALKSWQFLGLSKNLKQVMELKRFITVFTTARYLSLACDKCNPVQAVPHFFFKCHLILPTRLVFRLGSLPHVSPPKPGMHFHYAYHM
jgi:hypothetical protein